MHHRHAGRRPGSASPAAVRTTGPGGGPPNVLGCGATRDGARGVRLVRYSDASPCTPRARPPSEDVP
jgi:hypothetical protein